MGKQNLSKTEIQKKHSSVEDNDAVKLLSLLKDVDINDLTTALDAIKTAKKQSIPTDDTYKNYIDKTPVYEWIDDACIYERGDTKSGIWYFRIFDSKRQQPVFKSLKTKDKNTALASARIMYVDIKGKIERGERLKTITTEELIKLWLDKQQRIVTDIPHEGIVSGTFKSKKSYLNNWKTYLQEELKCWKSPIDKIKPETTRDFGLWLKSKPKQTALHTGGRSVEQINNNISEVIRMYHQVAIRDKYISLEKLPQIDRLKYEIDERFKRDIFTVEQYNTYWKYLKNKYVTKKHNPLIPPEELEKRKIFCEFILIIANVGFRSKELLGIKFKEITTLPTWNDDDKKRNVIMKVRRENAKTGRSRTCVAPVKNRIDRIIECYKKLGIEHQPDDFLFINPLSKTRNHYGRMIMYQRLKKTLELSGLQKELDKEDKSISPYSFRHFYAYLRLLNGVPIHLLAKQMGTSVQKIESTYGHIQVETQVDVITKAQGIVRQTDYILDTPVIVDE